MCLDEETFTAAAEGGHLELLKRLKELRCPISSSSAVSAAGDSLKY